MRFLRSLIRLRHNPTLFLPITRGPLHGFYHFMTGYFLPLFWESLLNPHRKMAVVDSEPFNHWFELLPGNPPEIVDRHRALKVAFKARFRGFASGYRVRAFMGWDKWLRFGRRPLARIIGALQSHLKQHVPPDGKELPVVLVFGRDHTPQYFRENLPTRYGVAKRNIPNLREIATGLNRRIPTMLVDPATLSPNEVFSLCQAASMVVAQHGAALTNCVFMEPGNHVIEIGWPDLAKENVLEMYRLLSEEIGLKWSRPILQKDRFSPISADELERLVLERLSTDHQ